VGFASLSRASQLIRGVGPHSTVSGGAKGPLARRHAGIGALVASARLGATTVRVGARPSPSAVETNTSLPTDLFGHITPAPPSRELVDGGPEARFAVVGGELMIRSLARPAGDGRVQSFQRGVSGEYSLLGARPTARCPSLSGMAFLGVITKARRNVRHANDHARGGAAQQADAADEAHGGWWVSKVGYLHLKSASQLIRGVRRTLSPLSGIE
jgi:hypothetical protein